MFYEIIHALSELARDLHVIMLSGSPPLVIQLLIVNCLIFAGLTFWRTKCFRTGIDAGARFNILCMLFNFGLMANTQSHLI